MSKNTLADNGLGEVLEDKTDHLLRALPFSSPASWLHHALVHRQLRIVANANASAGITHDVATAHGNATRSLQQHTVAPAFLHRVVDQHRRARLFETNSHKPVAAQLVEDQDWRAAAGDNSASTLVAANYVGLKVGRCSVHHSDTRSHAVFDGIVAKVTTGIVVHHNSAALAELDFVARDHGVRSVAHLQACLDVIPHCIVHQPRTRAPLYPKRTLHPIADGVAEEDGASVTTADHSALAALGYRVAHQRAGAPVHHGDGKALVLAQRVAQEHRAAAPAAQHSHVGTIVNSAELERWRGVAADVNAVAHTACDAAAHKTRVSTENCHAGYAKL